MLSPADHDHFAEWGVLRVPGLLPSAPVARLREGARAALEADGFWKDGAWAGERRHMFDGTVKKAVIERMKKSPDLKALVPPALLETVHALAGGRRLRDMLEFPQLLVTAPTAGEWVLPAKVWHLDVPRLGDAGLPGVQLFGFIGPVAPRGGGTMVVAGSHRLLNGQGYVRSKDVKKRLAREGWFKELLKGDGAADRSSLMEETGHAGDVPLRVVELCGEPGDVFFTDMRVLHTASPNASRTPRLMVTHRFFVEELIPRIGTIANAD